jgi:DNA-binding NarL/FixJ family response regulator
VTLETPAGEPTGESLRVRVVTVDDHPVIRDVVRLACSGHPRLEVVGEAASGREALEVCLRERPDVLVLDLILPDFDGFEVVRRLRMQGVDPKVLVVSARTDEGALFEARRLDIAGYLEKTAFAQRVAEAIEAVADGQRVFGAEQDRAAVERLGAMVREARERSRVVGALTRRELEVLHLAALGLTNGQMATRLGISARTVESHLAGLFRKLGARTRAEAVARALALGLLEMASDQGIWQQDRGREEERERE